MHFPLLDLQLVLKKSGKGGVDPKYKKQCKEDLLCQDIMLQTCRVHLAQPKIEPNVNSNERQIDLFTFVIQYWTKNVQLYLVRPFRATQVY